MRRGTTLPELLLALTLLAILALLAVPRVVAAHDAALVREELFRLIATLDRARGEAVRLASPVTLTLADSGYSMISSRGDSTDAAWQGPGPRLRGVTLSGAGAPLRFGASGLATGVANRTLILQRGGVTRRAVLSRLGRITW